MSEAEHPGTLIVAGARGVVGQCLIAHARGLGWRVRVLSRRPGFPEPCVSVTTWDPSRQARAGDAALSSLVAFLEGGDLLVNLAGTSVADGRMRGRHRRQILESRVDATQTLVRAHGLCEAPPPVVISGSATGFYGDRGEEDLDESSPAGGGFLAAVCRRWEEAAHGFEGRARLVRARLGVVFAEQAPAWKRLVLPLRLGVGGPLGSGRQWWSWIDGRDLARALLFAQACPELSGPVNFTAPEPVRQGDLTQQIATLLGRPALCSPPLTLLRLALGDVPDELLLPSVRALPRKLEAAGFRWDAPHVGRQLLTLLA